MVQFHALALLHALRARDRLAVSKLVSQLVRSSFRSSLAQCLLVRYVSQVHLAHPSHVGLLSQVYKRGALIECALRSTVVATSVQLWAHNRRRSHLAVRDGHLGASLTWRWMSVMKKFG